MTKQPITMLNDRLLVQIPQVEGERASRGGILIPATAQVSKRLAWAEVVASAVGGIPEIVVEDVTGHLVPLVPDGAEFAAALAGRVNALIADPERAAAMGRAGRLRAIEAFGWPAVAARTVALYERLVP